MRAASVVDLQQKLFKRMGLDTPRSVHEKNLNRRSTGVQIFPRKDMRKVTRAQKRTQRYSRQTQPLSKARPMHDLEHVEGEMSVQYDGEGVDSERRGMKSGWPEPSSPPSDEPEGGDGLSSAMRKKLVQDNAEIEAFEKKLGIKRSRKSLPKAFQEDGLAKLLGNSEGGASVGEDETNKRKREFDDWLSSKRRSTASNIRDASKRNGNDRDRGTVYEGVHTDTDDNDDEDDIKRATHTETGEDIETDSDDESLGDFANDGDDAAIAAQLRQRENPYVAPATGLVISRYIPPSRRAASASTDETRDRLQKQIQGQINRLTDSNILSIVQSMDDIYQQNARGDVTELLTDVIMAQVCRPASLPDQFFVLTGGFCAAVYKIVGSSFGSHLLRQVVKEFEEAYGRISQDSGTRSFQRKETSNLITFLTQLYVFEAVGCRILFDYMERLLSDLSEVNVELLARICRMAGRLLRRDDPQALRHVSESLAQAVSGVDPANVSVRTKYMIEVINDLRNNRPKAKGLESAVVSEQVLRMRKRLGNLKSQSWRLDGLTAMGIGLDDLKGADMQGKWWLVGASVPSYRQLPARAKTLANTETESENNTTDDEDMDFVLPDYPNKARAQGLATTAQIAIFTALMSANSHEQGYLQYANLKLRKDEQLEIARVLVQCVGSEAQYNEYYVLVGSLACANGRVRFAFQDRLWKMLRGLGESLFGEVVEEEETADSERMKDGRRAGHVARLYASLVANGALSICILRPLDLHELNKRASSFVERFMVGLLDACAGDRAEEDARIEKVFGPARGLPSFAAGIHWFLGTKVRKTRLIEDKNRGRLAKVRAKAQAAVQAGATKDIVG